MTRTYRRKGVVEPCQSCYCTNATRTVYDKDGTELRLCDTCPSPEEVEKQTAEIRDEWKDRQWRQQANLDSQRAIIPTMIVSFGLVRAWDFVMPNE